MSLGRESGEGRSEEGRSEEGGRRGSDVSSSRMYAEEYPVTAELTVGQQLIDCCYMITM